MEFLVVMTTRVPDGVPEREVADVRSREAAHTHVLALEGHVQRLWRPPVVPGVWRTIGLFAAADPDDLERVLASMPLRIWRTDDITPLGTHPNDPGPGRTAINLGQPEFLTTFVVTVPADARPERVHTVLAQEADRARELADEGRLIRLWTRPRAGGNLGLWQAPDGVAMQDLVAALPMADWLTTDIVPLTPHPSDPVQGDARATPPSSLATHRSVRGAR